MTENEKNSIVEEKKIVENKNEKSFVQSLEECFLKTRKKLKIIKYTKRIFKIATILTCLLSATLFFTALIEKNIARSSFKKTQEYHEIIKENSEELYLKLSNEKISNTEYISETKALGSNKFVDKQILNSKENFDIKKKYQNRTSKNIGSVCSIVCAAGLATSQIFLNKKMAKAGKEEQFYQKFFR